ncbi:uncharacterized protein LOC119111414 [Pollicipes pollicipes]|uniref:uncharacterized protein LOC119111414 n=1 Tax=Pollicipes pollicipes TaxID=41117 RepID=UPI001885267A|nr:uncharacterized protein LOC119111414 [Pollicipes pollicipes]
MKYPQLVSTPAVVKEWLETELECLGIDSAAYARTVLSLLARDTIDPAEVIQSGYVLVANKCGRGAGGPGGPHPPRTREEELKRAEVIECLRSASEDHCGIQLLVDQLISMLKQLPASEATSSADIRRRPDTVDAPTDDPVLRYEAAFPALSRGSPSVVPLTYFSKMGRAPTQRPVSLSAWCADAAPADRWHSTDDHPTTAVWPTALRLSLLLHPAGLAGLPDAVAGWPGRLAAEPLTGYTSLSTAPLELAAGLPEPPPPPPKPPERPADAARAIQPSADTHFQPIRRASDGDDEPAGWASPATYDARLYTRSDSGGLYLEDEPRPAADRPQKYMVYHEPAPGRGLVPKFKLSCNEKYCQTDEAVPADGAGRDLLQILVSGEQSGAVPDVEADDDDDSSHEVLSSLQHVLHSIYEDGSDAAADDSELEPPAAGEQPEPARPAGTVYRQGPTEYPPLRYQLAGRDLPEVTFCRLSSDTHSAASWQEEPALTGDAAIWECSSDDVRASRESSVTSEASGWPGGGERADDATLWQLISDALWESHDLTEREMAIDETRWECCDERARRKTLEKPVGKDPWEPRGDDCSLEKPVDKGPWEPRGDHSARNSADRSVWESQLKMSVDAPLWESPTDLVEREPSLDALWQLDGELRSPSVWA